MTAPTPIRVFLLDDHEIVRRGLRTLLEAEDDIEVVGEAGRVADAIPRSLRSAPTSRSSTAACPTAPASRCAARCVPSTPRSRA